jgi:hypothetical protein
MNAAALALPTPLPVTGLPAASEQPAGLPTAVPALLPTDTVAQAAMLLRAACRRGQLEDASAAARIALRSATPQSPHQALLRCLAQAHPALMVAPEEDRLYLLRDADGSPLGLLRLRDSGAVTAATPCPTANPVRWQLRDGNLDLCDGTGQVQTRFALCGQFGGDMAGEPGGAIDGERLYLGESLGTGQLRLLQELRCTYTRLRLLDPELADPFCSLFDARALVSAPLPARPALLLAGPHAGSAALRQALNRSIGIFIDGELLQPRAIHLAEGELPAAGAGALFALRDKDPAWFARMMMNRSHDGAGRDLAAVPVRGFTLATLHSSAVLDWAIAEPRLRIVHVVRSNLLAQFADILADQPGAAAAEHDGAGLCFEPERFIRFVDMQRRSAADLRQRLVRRNADTVEVDSSRLNAATLDELVDFLSDGAAAAAAAAPALAPAPADGTGMAPRRVIARFDNPEDVARCLADLGCPGWAEVEGLLPDIG